MKVSVIIPFRNRISFLDECLQSLAEQTFKDMEVLLICDHAEEEIQSLIETYQDKLLIRVSHLEEKTGVAAARNHGISIASGEYVYFLDSDDYISENALELLVAKAEESNADLIYGKLVQTWLKRSMFLSNQFKNDDSEDVEEDDYAEEDGNSEDSFNESQGADDDTTSQYSNASIGHREAFSYLIEKRKGFRGISILHQLIRRSLIIEHHIDFNENIKYLSDYPFLLQVLEAANSCQAELESKYMKRNYADDDNPQLSQENGSKGFREYFTAYEYAKGLIKRDSKLRNLIDKKVIHYCINFFAPKILDNHDRDKEKQFKRIHKNISEMDRRILQAYTGYQGKLLQAFADGNMKRAKDLVKGYRRRATLRKITSSRFHLGRWLYDEFFLKLSMKEKWVLCSSFFGRSYSDSPKYIYEYLSKNYPGKFRFIWVIENKKTKIPYPHTKVKRFSIRYFYYVARCKYYVINSRQSSWVKKRKGNVFLQTWHGTPLKRLVFDLEDINAATVKYKKTTYKLSRAWDYLIAPNQYSSDIFRRCFRFDKVMLETGYPRNDILHSEHKEELSAQIKDKLGIPRNKKTILYAPTWRDDEYYTKTKYKFSLKLDLQQMKEKLGNEYVVLLRTHYFIVDVMDITGLEGFAFDVSKYDDIAELYLISDMLITDYSSVFYDYANLKRPMLFYTYDLEKYRDVIHGFYNNNIEDYLPGPMLFTTEEVISAIQNIDRIIQQYHDKYEDFYDKYCSWENGHSTEKVVEAVFKLSRNK